MKKEFKKLVQQLKRTIKIVKRFDLLYNKCVNGKGASYKMQKTINVFDVANYIIENNSFRTTHMKLHKMIYYVYAKYLIENDNSPLFKTPLRAWVYGPVFPELYKEFKDFTYLPIDKSSPKGNTDKISHKLKNIIDEIILLYGNKTGNELSNLTHQESPWQLSYNGSVGWEQNIITDEMIVDYFKGNLHRIQK